MNKLILYKDLDGNTMVMLCTKEGFYKGVFKEDAAVEVKKEIDIEGDLELFPTNCPLSADF